jgi:hypothetical protein
VTAIFVVALESAGSTVTVDVVVVVAINAIVAEAEAVVVLVSAENAFEQLQSPILQPPPHTQQASLAVNPKLLYCWPSVLHFE